MSENKHTPGPWKFSALGRIVVDSAEQVVCRPAAYMNNTERQAANARLIAAAPDLFDFASLVSRMTTDSEMGGNMSGDDAAQALSELIETARAAIASVNGEQ